MELSFGPGVGTATESCYFCRLSKSEPYVNTKRLDQCVYCETYSGEMVICKSCIEEMAHLIGMFSSATRDKWLRKLDEQDKRLGKLREKGAAYDMFIAKLEESRELLEPEDV